MQSVIHYLESIQRNDDRENSFESKTVIEASGLLKQLKIQVSLYHFKFVVTYMVTQKAYESNSKVLQLKSSKNMKCYPL